MQVFAVAFNLMIPSLIFSPLLRLSLLIPSFILLGILIYQGVFPSTFPSIVGDAIGMYVTRSWEERGILQDFTV